MKIVCFEVEHWERHGLERELGREHDLTLLSQQVTEETAHEHRDAEVISPFIYSQLGRDVLSSFERLKLIATRSTGFDHVDQGYCEEKGITVSNVPTYGCQPVAEHVFGLLLTISHRLVEDIDRTRKGEFSLEGPPGFELRDKTMGVIGTGDIGKCVIEIATGFRMKVIAYNRTRHEELASEMGFQYVDLDELLRESDIITLHVPATKETHHMISEDEFKKMKRGVVLINTARGSIVDVQALARAVAEGRVKAAGLDVLPEEPVIREEAELLSAIFRDEQESRVLLFDHVLMRLRDVVITPHSAFYTREALGRIVSTTVENIRSFVRGETQNVVIGGGKQ